MAGSRGDDSLESEAPLPSPIAALLATHRSAFLGFLERRIGSRAVAEDILQEAFAKGLHHTDGLRSEESAVAWFYRVLRNAVVDYHRRNQSSARMLDAFAAELLTAEEPRGEVEAAVCQCVARMASTLKPEYADALQRIEVEGVAVKSFAAEVGISSSNAAVRIFRAREALRKQVVSSCGSCAKHGCVHCTCGTSPELT